MSIVFGGMCFLVQLGICEGGRFIRMCSIYDSDSRPFRNLFRYVHGIPPWPRRTTGAHGTSLWNLRRESLVFQGLLSSWYFIVNSLKRMI